MKPTDGGFSCWAHGDLQEAGRIQACCVCALAPDAEAGADPMLKDNFGGTCMMEAVKSAKDDIIDLLLEHDAS